MPLFLRSERGQIQERKIKLAEKDYEISNKQLNLANKVQASLQKQAILQQQVQLQRNNLSGYSTLLDAENEKFNLGESSVFLLNKRLEKVIDGQIKLAKSQTKYQQELLNYLYLTNSLLPKTDYEQSK